MEDSSKSKSFYSEIAKLREKNKDLLIKTENFFKKLESPNTLTPNIQYSDDEKLCFCLNYFNFRLMHQLLFKEKKFPKQYSDWRELVNQTKFILFGYPEKPIYWLDQAVIR